MLQYSKDIIHTLCCFKSQNWRCIFFKQKIMILYISKHWTIFSILEHCNVIFIKLENNNEMNVTKFLSLTKSNHFLSMARGEYISTKYIFWAKFFPLSNQLNFSIPYLTLNVQWYMKVVLCKFMHCNSDSVYSDLKMCNDYKSFSWFAPVLLPFR